MAISILRGVLEASATKGSTKLVLIALANRANKSGAAWPSLQTISGDCGLSVRQVRRALRQLELAGEIETTRSPGRKSSTYRLREPGHLVLVEPGQNRPPTRTNASLNPDRMSANPFKEPKDDPYARARLDGAATRALLSDALALVRSSVASRSFSPAGMDSQLQQIYPPDVARTAMLEFYRLTEGTGT
jgi:hypothetical protein